MKEHKGEENMNEQPRLTREQRIKRRKRKRLLRRLVQISFYLVIFLIVLLIGHLIKRQFSTKKSEETTQVSQDITEPQEKTSPITATILSAGDVIMHDPFLDSNHYLDENGSYDYTNIFDYTRDLYQNADYAVVNMESTISDSNYQGFPLFRAPAAIATALSDVGADLCLLANNHIYDNFDDGLSLTINAVEKNSMSSIGVRKSTTEKKYLVKEINGIKVGFFNYVYETGPMNGQEISINAIPVSSESAPLINSFSYDDLETFYGEIQQSLEEMKKDGVEYTIAYLHWGEEYQTTENKTQETIAAQLCELGIDALIGGHPHVVQPVDLLTNTSGDHQMLCVYSLGNHLSNQYRERMGDTEPTGHTEDGLMIELVLEKIEDQSVSLADVEFIPTWVYRTPDVGEDENPEFFILPLNNPQELLEQVNLPNLEADIEESLNRTNEIIGNGTKKVKNALPLN